MCVDGRQGASFVGWSAHILPLRIWIVSENKNRVWKHGPHLRIQIALDNPDRAIAYRSYLEIRTLKLKFCFFEEICGWLCQRLLPVEINVENVVKMSHLINEFRASVENSIKMSHSVNDFTKGTCEYACATRPRTLIALPLWLHIQCGAVITRSIFFKILTIDTP